MVYTSNTDQTRHNCPVQYLHNLQTRRMLLISKNEKPTPLTRIDGLRPSHSRSLPFSLKYPENKWYGRVRLRIRLDAGSLEWQAHLTPLDFFSTMLALHDAKTRTLRSTLPVARTHRIDILIALGSSFATLDLPASAPLASSAPVSLINGGAHRIELTKWS